MTLSAKMFHDIAVEEFKEALKARDRGDVVHAKRLAVAALLAIETASTLLDALADPGDTHDSRPMP